MPISATTLEMLMSAGLQGQALLDVVRAVESDHTKKRSDAAERQARYRERKKAQVATGDITSVTTNDANSDALAHDVDINNLPSENIKTNLPLSPSKPQPDGFDSFWACYPKRSGPADRKAAVKAFGPALKRADLETILHGARAYNAEMTAKGKVGTEFVKQARTWLNADGWTEYQASAPLTTVESTKVYVKYGTDAGDAWERYYRVVLKKPPPRDFKGGWYFPTEYPEQEAA